MLFLLSPDLKLQLSMTFFVQQTGHIVEFLIQIYGATTFSIKYIQHDTKHEH